MCLIMLCIFYLFFFNDTATTEIYTLSLHDALPILIFCACKVAIALVSSSADVSFTSNKYKTTSACRSEEHTSELQSRQYLVCRLLLEKKKTYEKFFDTDIYLRRHAISGHIFQYAIA